MDMRENNTLRVIIDRFESNFAVCETEEHSMINIEVSSLPKGVKQGDVLIIENDKIEIDNEQTKKLKKEIETLMDDLWE